MDELTKDLIKIVVDKGILAIVVAFVGYLISRKLEDIKKDNAELQIKFKADLDTELKRQDSEYAKIIETFKNEQSRLNKLAEQTQDLKNELQKQRDTRAFDKRLDWYERTIRSLHDMAQKIEIASTFEEEKKEPEEEKKKEHRIRCWRDVQRAHLNLSTLSDEARIYGTEEAAIQTERIIKKVDDVAYESEAFEPEFAAKNLKLIDTLPIELRKAATPLAKEARTHLGLD